MVRRYKLDFDELPIVESMSMFKGMDSDLVARMVANGSLAETVARAQGAVMLFHDTPKKAESWHSGAYIRGGLAEFRAMHGALRRDLAKAGSGERQSAHAPEDSTRPLLHLMSLLRDVEIHTSPAVLRPAETKIRYPGRDGNEVDFPIVVIDDIDADRLRRKRETRDKYRPDDLERIVNWFSVRRHDFGAPYLLARGVELYSLEILLRHPRQVARLEQP